MATSSEPIADRASPSEAPPALVWIPERRPWGAGDVVSLVLWTVAIGWFFADVLFLGKALFYFDITEINFPYRDFLARELRAGRFSRWCPGLYCGLPLYSESQAGYLHPLKYLLYPWMATWRAFNLDTVLSIWLTGLGAYGWLRRHVGAAGALTGASLFALSGFMWAHLIHTSMVNALASVPFAFWALEVAWDRGRLWPLALGAFAVACQVFAGHLQDTLLTCLALGLYALYWAGTERAARRRGFVLGSAALLVALAALISAVQWIPSRELLERSPRAGGLSWDELTYGSWHPELLPTALVREAYGTRAHDTDWMDGFYPYHEMNVYLGIGGLALALVGAAAYRDRWAGFFVLLAGMGFLLMLGKFTFLFDFMNRVPILGSSRIPVRYHLWVSLAVAALAAVGVDRLGRPGAVRLRWAVLTIALLALICVPILIYIYEPVWAQPKRWTMPYHQARYRWLAEELVWAAGRTGLLAGAVFGVALCAARVRSVARRARLVYLLPVLVILDLLGAHWRDVPSVEPSYWTSPPASVRVVARDPRHIRVFGMGQYSAGEPGYASERVDFRQARDTLAWSLPIVWGLSSAGGATPMISRRALDYFETSRLSGGRFDLEGVTHLLVGRPDGARGWGTPTRAGGAYIFHNAQALPRARLVGRPAYATSQHEAVALMRHLGPAVRERLVVEDRGQPIHSDADVTGSALITHDEPERVAVVTSSRMPAYLVLSDTFDPGWTATLDDQGAVPIRPAYVAFRAVYVPAGKHRVVFRYEPAGFQLGLGLSAIGAVAAMLVLVWPRRLTAPSAPHGDAGWPRFWPAWGLALAALIVAGSAVGFDAQGVHVHKRWAGSFHRFTWGAGIEAMRPGPPGNAAPAP